MVRPQMDADPTALDRVPHAQPVTTMTCVHEALAHLHTTGETAAIVYGNGGPVGVVTAAALAHAAKPAHGDVPVARVMDYVAVHVDTNTNADETVRTFTDTAWDWLGRRHR